MDDNIAGIINIYKEKGFTSHDVVNIVRKTLGRVKTGHTGTLDPEAEGVLPVCIGKATKLADYIAADIKEYRCELTLGVKTTTEDHTGEILEVLPVECNKQDIESAVLSFIGEYNQKPPMYSAIKVNGKKLYELAREGKEIERKTRLINIYDINDINVTANNKVEMTVLCSKGTYIRTLCKDIGDKLGCGGHMSVLLRTRSGNFYLKDSVKLEQLKAMVTDDRLNEILQPMENVLSKYNKVTVDNKAEKYLYNGNKISINYLDNKGVNENEKVIVYDCNNRLIGVYQVVDGGIKPITMLI